MTTDDQYEIVGRIVTKTNAEIASEYNREVGIGQFSFYRFGMWVERNYPDTFSIALTSRLMKED